MSRIGKRTILIPATVTVSHHGNTFDVKGPKGNVKVSIRPEISVKIDGSTLTTEIKINTKSSNAYLGLSNALLSNAIKGVSEGFEKKLEMVGVGYRVKQNGSDISLSLGFSHPVEIKATEGISFGVPDQQTIIISGPDKQNVGLVAAKIRKLRKPEPYKGKGIKYSNEIVRRKAGKSGKV